MKVFTIGLGILAFAFVLTACGGSDGGATPSDSLATITADNAPTIAGAVMTSALEGSDLGAFADLGSATGSFGTVKPQTSLAKAAAPRIASAKTLLEDSQIGLMQAPVGPVTETCSGGGTLTVSGSLASETNLSAGDTIVFEFADCGDGEVVIDGRFAMTISSFSGDFVGGSFAFGIDVELSGFSVTEGEETASAEGDLSITLDATEAPSLTMTVSSTSLSVSADGSTHTLGSFSSTRIFDGAAGTYSLSSSGSLTSTAFDGTVNFETTASLEGTGDGYAGSGELLITGAAGATITVHVLDSTMLRLDVDSDGDGTVDNVIDLSWSELD